MGAVKINLNKIVGERVHAPRIDGFALYKRIDGAVETSTTGTGTKTERWEKRIATTYTSPTNIRRIFITHAGVGIELYAPIKGLPGITRWTPFNVDFKDVLADMQQATTGRPPEYRVTGSGLQAVIKGWVCSNIEEVYFDWSIFTSSELLNLGYGNLFLQLPNGAGKVRSPLVEQLFKRICTSDMTDKNKISDRFPRLKQVGYIEDLAFRFQQTKSLNKKRSIKSYTEDWLTSSVADPNIQNPTIAVWKVPGVPAINTKYSLKAGTYTYDAEVLTPFFNNLDKELTEYARSLRDGTAEEKFEVPDNLGESPSEQPTKKTKGSLEKSFDVVYAQGGEQELIRAIAIVFKGSSKAERLEEYRELTPDGQSRYGKYMKIGIQ